MTERAQPQTPIANASDAEQAIADLNGIMDRLVRVIEEETTRVRSGRVSAAVELEATKRALARSYAVQVERMRAARDIVRGSGSASLDGLRDRHASFQATLSKNMTVLATAHAVGEGIVRAVSSELARKQAPSTYGASGRANAPSSRASQPLAVSKAL
jgi:hypothetical protein